MIDMAMDGYLPEFILEFIGVYWSLLDFIGSVLEFIWFFMPP